MDVEYLRAQFVETVQTMFEENYVDDYFKMLYLEHRAADSPDIVPDCIRSFFVDAEKHMDEIEAALRQFPVDFKQITLGTARIMRKTAWIGAARIHRKSCVALINSILAADRDECRFNMWKLRTEVSLLRNRLNHILTLQEDIVTIDGQVPLDWCQGL